MDSGAGKSCVPKALTKGYVIEPSAGSMAGQKFVGPGGEKYPNEGQVRLEVVTEAGLPGMGDFQVAEGLQKPLAAVSDSCDKGNLCLFDNDGSFVIPRDSIEGRKIREAAAAAKVKTTMHRKNGVYTVPVWVQPGPSRASIAPFRRQGR